MKKRVMMTVITALLTCAVLSGCGKKNNEASSKKESSVSRDSKQSVEKTNQDLEDTGKKYKVVCTIFPEYDWIREIVGDKKENFEITYLLNKGVDLHSYQPTAEDLAKVSEADLFVYVGGESDSWVQDALKERTNQGMKVVNLLETLGNKVKEEEIVEGMEDHDHDHDHDKDDHDHDHDKDDHDHDHDKDDHDHDHDKDDHDHDHDKNDHDHDHDHDKDDHDHDHDKDDHDHDHDHDKDDHDHDHDKDDHDNDHHHHDAPELDEHVWLSLRNTKDLVTVLSEKVAMIDVENAAVYKENTEKYLTKLSELDEKYMEAVKNSPKKTLLFGDRFPFRYLTDDYDLDYYAAFVGCSAESEASFETVAFLAKKTDELGLSKICVIENSDGKVAKTVNESTKEKNNEIVTLNSMQSINEKDVADGITYLSVMEKNLEVLKSALQ